MSEELKPCPFCGGQPELHLIGNERSRTRKIIIKCTKCRIMRTDAAIKNSISWLEDIAIKNWNTRTADKTSYEEK